MNHRFSQNYPQLMNQAMASGFNEVDLRRLRDAFELALKFADGIYRMQGVPLLNHLVSTASIVMYERKNPDLVIACLVHAAYVLHLFDDSRRSPNLQKRRASLREIVGAEVEEMAWEFEHIPWFRASRIQRYIDEYDNLTTFQKDVLVMRLANEVDDYLDNAVEYTNFGNKGVRSDECFNLCLALAEKMELTVIRDSFLEMRAIDQNPPDCLIRNKQQGYEISEPIWLMTLPEKLVFQLKRITIKVRALVSNKQ